MKKKLFFLLTLLVCCVGQVWGASASYNLVTDASSLKSGDVIVIGCSSQNVAASAMGTGTFLTSVSATFKDDVLTADGAVEITLSGDADGWTLTTPDGAIGAKAAKKMALDDGTTTWTISIATDGTATISSTNLSYGRILYNVQSPRFLNYSSNTSASMLLPQIYKKSTTPPTDVLQSLTVSGTPTKVTYEAGEEFDPAGLTVTGSYSESGNKTVTSNIDWEITPETLTVGTTSVSVVAKVGDVESSEYIVNGVTVIAPKTLTSIAISGTPTKMEYKVGDAFDPAGLVVTGKYSDYSQEEITEGIEWIITPATFAEADVAASVSVVAKVGDIESSPYMATGLIVKEKTTPSALVVDFENALDTYTDWVFTNAEQGKTTITAHGGTYYGTTGGKTTASIQTKDIIAAPQSFTCYISKQSTNTAACTWSIQVSSDGDNWTDVATTDAKAMNKGVWVEFSADLSSYANVYVRIYYSGTTAVRNIDDITLVVGSPSTDPSISASNVDIAADATSGEIAYTINNPVAGQTLTATTEASWISNIQVTDEKVTFATTANTEATERSADITLKYEGATDKVVTVTQKAAAAVLTTIDQIFAKATEAGSTAAEVSVKFDGWYVTGVKGSNAYATDGTKGFIIFEKNHGFVVGDALTGTVTCKVQLFNGSAELTQLTTSTEGLTVTPNHSISAVEKTIDQLSGINTGAVVTIKNVTYDGANFTDGTNDIVPFNSLMTLPTFEENGKYNITGVYLQFNTSAGEKKEILPRSEADIEPLATTKYTITWSVNGTTTDEEVNEGAAIDFIPATVPAGYTDYVFRGWTTESTVDAEPTYVTEATATADITYYAVFARKSTTDGGSGDYEKVTTTPDAWAGEYLLVYESEENSSYGQTLSANKTDKAEIKKPTAIDIVDGTVAADETTEANAIFITENATSGYLLQTQSGYYFYNTTSTDNGFSVSNNESTAKKYEVTLAIDTDGNAVITAAGAILRYNTGSTIFQFYKPSSASGQKPVCLYKKQAGTVTYSDFCTVLPTGLPVVIGETGYATFYDRDNRIIPTGVKAYYCTQGEEGVLNTVQITNLSYIPRWTGVILEGTPGTYYFEEIPTIMADEEETDKIMDDGVLNGTIDNMSMEEFHAEFGANSPAYVFSKVNDRLGFYKFAGDTLAGRKAFYVPKDETEVNGFTLDFGGQTVGINSVISATNLKAGYDIQGRKLNKMQKGINILGGKKIIK